MAFLLNIIKLLTINVLYIQLLVVILQRFKNINMGELRKYKAIIRKGTVGNTEYWTDQDWDKHRLYVEELKESGEYLNEEEITIIMEYNELLDKSNLSESCISTRFEMIDLNK